MNVLIVGVNGFIGSHLAKRILDDTKWHVYGMDIRDHYLTEIRDHSRFHFTEGDISINNEWIEYHIKKCDVILPLVAIAQPMVYVNDPLSVFELDFEENLKIVRWTQKYARRLIFPSTSEVYGMCREPAFSEEKSELVYGPVSKTRWIYASCKQLLDRIIVAYGRDRGLAYTLFRPFNWIGPKLDSMESARYGNSRVLTQFITRLMRGRAIHLVNGGSQSRTFTDISDGLDALMTILQRPERSNGKIFNLGNPANTCTIADLANLVRKIFIEVTGAPADRIPEAVAVSEEAFYGKDKGFQDITHRVPDITQARALLDWNPSVAIASSVFEAVRFFVSHAELYEKEVYILRRRSDEFRSRAMFWRESGYFRSHSRL